MMYAHFSYPSVSNPNMIFVPPYINMHRSLAQDPLPQKDSHDIQCYNVSTWQVNIWIMIPMLLHFLCAEQKNMTNAETAQSPEIKMLVLYTARYHIGQKGMAVTGPHGAINRLYGLNMTDSLGMGENSII